MTTRERALELVGELVEAVNTHDTARLLTFYAENAVAVSPVSGQIAGRAAIARWWDAFFSSFPDWTANMSDLLVDGDRIVFFGTGEATDQNGWFGLPATGERFQYRAMIVLTMAEGKIVREERIYDLSNVLQRLEKARLDKELKTAAEVQRALFSRTCRLTGFCEVVADSLPCRAIGGDFFDSTQFSSGELGIALGDVAGKGPASAILASMIQGMLAVQLESEPSPSATLAHLDRLLASRHLEPRFATLVYGVLSPNGQFVYSNAGHNPPIVLTPEGIRRLRSGGPILGAFGNSPFEEESILLGEGDMVIMFSDGIIEARDDQDQEFGDDRLISCVVAYRNRPVSEIVKSILSSVMQFCKAAPQTDDMTIMVMQVHQSRSRGILEPVDSIVRY